MLRGFQLLAWAVGFIVVVASTPVFAEEKEKDEPRTKRTQSISAKVYEKLEKAQEAEGKNDNRGALAILEAMKNEKLTEYELAMVWNMIGSVKYNMDNYTGAVQAFQNVLKFQDIPEAMRQTVTYGLAQLYFATEKYPQTIQTLQQWYKLVEKPSADAYALEGQAYYQMEKYRESISPLLKALAIAKERNITLKEPWLGVLRASYYELNDYPKAAKILEILVTLYPKKSYWLQLAGLYGLLERELDQLGAMEAAWEQGLLDQEKELTNLAQLLLYHEIPWKAAQVIERGIKAKVVKENYSNLRLYAQALALAQEGKGQLAIMEKAARLAPDGEMHVFLGQAYTEAAEWKKAAKALSEAIRKGVRRPGTARIMLGIARFNADDLDGAAKVFRQARNDKGSEQTATQWLKHIENERIRREALAAYAE